MIFAVLASDQQKEEMAASAFFQQHELLFSENLSLWSNHIADVYMDLRDEFSTLRIAQLAKLLPKPVLVNSMVDTLDQLHPDFIRINAWPGFLKGNLLEAAAAPQIQETAVAIFGEHIKFVKDVPGFVSARIVAMIINEAFFALEAGVASKADIDFAMKEGTGYPYGPFEWESKIGGGRVGLLLKRLSEENSLYEIAEGLRIF